MATGRVVFEWHSLDHVAIDESQVAVQTAAGAVYDYFHINAVSVDFDGNFIISARNTWNAGTSSIAGPARSSFRLGGKRSSFRSATACSSPGSTVPEPVDPTTIRDLRQRGPRRRQSATTRA